MKIITQSQGTLWNIYLKLLYQGLETDDQNSPLLAYTAQDYCDREGSEGKGGKQDINLFPLFPWQLFVWMFFFIKCLRFLFFPMKVLEMRKKLV